MFRVLCGVPLFLSFLAPVLSASSQTITLDWEVTWVWAEPDGFGRPVIGINNTWPCPVIEASIGDTVVINLKNKLGNETTGLHFHGINQINSNYMDGAVGTSQCPLPPNHSVTYSFTANEAGTYWYHSHNMAQYPDGFRGPLIIHNPKDPYLDHYDADVLLTLSDWYHAQSPKIVQEFLQPNNTNFQPPRPDGVLVNEGSDGVIPIEPNKTYRFRIINFSALTAAFVAFNALQMEVIMVDGTYVHKSTANQLRVLTAQRYDVLVKTGPGSKQNYPYLIALDTNPDYLAKDANPPIGFHHNFTGQLANDVNGNLAGKSAVDHFYPQDDMLLSPFDNQSAFEPVTKQWVLNFDYCDDVNGYPRACFNGKTFIGQQVPTLYSVLSLGKNNTEVSAYGQVNAFTIPYGGVLEIIINNHDTAIHPFHLHGHQFQIIERAASHAGNYSRSKTVPDRPIRRDTVHVNSKSYTVLRIRATNPGVFLFHCHIEWHVEMGLTATLIEAPERLSNYTVPKGFIDICKAQGVATEGNAAGHEDWANTKGFITVNPTSYAGALYVQSVTPSTPKASPTPTPSPAKSPLARRSLQKRNPGILVV